MEELKMAMIGGWSSVFGFKAVGVDPYVVSTPAEAPAVWESLPREDYAVVMVTEPVYEYLRGNVAGFPAHEGLPIVLPVPAVTGSLGIARREIRNKVVKALGSVIEEQAGKNRPGDSGQET